MGPDLAEVRASLAGVLVAAGIAPLGFLAGMRVRALRPVVRPHPRAPRHLRPRAHQASAPGARRPLPPTPATQQTPDPDSDAPAEDAGRPGRAGGGRAGTGRGAGARLEVVHAEVRGGELVLGDVGGLAPPAPGPRLARLPARHPLGSPAPLRPLPPPGPGREALHPPRRRPPAPPQRNGGHGGPPQSGGSPAGSGGSTGGALAVCGSVPRGGTAEYCVVPREIRAIRGWGWATGRGVDYYS